MDKKPNEKNPKVVKKETKETKETGGSTKIEVDTVPAVVPEVGSEVEPEPEPDPEPERTPEALMVNEALVETVAKVIGKTTSLLTRIPEMDFDESEVEQLKNLWSPLVPVMSPILIAVMGTSIIVLGKVAIFASMRKEKQPLKEDKLEEHKID